MTQGAPRGAPAKRGAASGRPLEYHNERRGDPNHRAGCFREVLLPAMINGGANFQESLHRRIAVELISLRAPSAHQNVSFNPNCTCRPKVFGQVIWPSFLCRPRVARNRAAAGSRKLAWLNKLKNSARNSRFIPSCKAVKAVFLT